MDLHATQNTLAWNFAMQQPKLFQSNAHRDRRDEKNLSEGLGNAIKRFVVNLGPIEIADSKVEPRNFDIGMADRLKILTCMLPML
jgi:hypothetical protein